jgi:asparagine synthase (glutamine-hydrolysing)
MTVRNRGDTGGLCGIVLREKNNELKITQIHHMVQVLDQVEQSRVTATTWELGGIGIQEGQGCLARVAELLVHERPVVMAFYGSLYNTQEGISAKGGAQNPVMTLLRSYLEKGMEFLQRLRGEFVLALWNGLTKTFCLATDRFRVHPLFYYCSADYLVFASRIRSILASPFPVPVTINPEAIVDVTVSSIIPTPKTIFREIYKLPPGHMLTYRAGEAKIEPYWDLSFITSSGISVKELSRDLKRHLTEAIDIRLKYDGVPKRVGTFLSGGIDSSTVTGVLSQLAKCSIKSFSIGFGEERFNEMEYAQIAAKAFGADHYTYFVTPQDTYTALPVLLNAFDEPFANASAVPTYFCCKLAQEQGVEVLYAGDGGDELFAGNERYASQRLFDYYYKIPTWLRESIVKPLVFDLADKLKWPLFTKGKKYIQRATVPYPKRISSYGLLSLMPMTALFEESFLEEVGAHYNPDAVVSTYYSQAPALTDLDRHLYLDLKLAISDNDLFKVTRMSTAAGVAVRFPFLDHQLAEFAATIPASLKMRGTQLRSFFKKAYADLLPAEIRTKQKHGFGLPIPVWLRTNRQLNELMHDLLFSSQALQRGYFQRKAVEELVIRHQVDETSFYGTVLWHLMILELWHRSYFASMPKQA